MTTYEELIAEADHLRVDLYKPHQAIGKYEAALDIGGPRDRHCLQMIGVCYKIERDYDQAIAWFKRAVVGASDYELGNIYRDWADAKAGQGHYQSAEALLRNSLDLLPYSERPEEHAITCGFLARNLQRQGDIIDAIKHYAAADRLLAEGTNRHFELYNKLHYADALSQGGGWISSRVKAVQAFCLARKYGARAHKMRALILIVGGYRLDFLAQKLFRP